MNCSQSESNVITDLVEVYSRDPFFSPIRFCSDRNITAEAFNYAIETVKGNKNLYPLLLEGPARQYWKSIDGVRNKTNFDSAVKGRPAYPSRLGLYPGITCQFHCQFCGRREGTEFAGNLAKHSVELFDRILTDHVQVPNHAKTIRLSGGLEPTTNKHITDIIRLIHSKGLQAELYTNGFNFVPAWLDKQPGIYELDRVRFSIYGHDNQSYAEFTEHASSGIVLENIRHFLNTSTVPVGVNYVILTNRLDQFSQFIDWIKMINETTRGLSWISLREDSSQHLWQLTNNERKNIHTHLHRLESITMGSTNIDYGYTLWPLREQDSIGNIAQASVEQLLPKAFPQISVVVDIEGNVYPYHDVFPNRLNQERHCLGRIGKKDLFTLIEEWLSNSAIAPTADDLKFVDTSDHMITLLIRQQQELDTLGTHQWLI